MKRLLFFALLSLGGLASAQASGPRPADASEVRALESRLEKLETETSAWQKIAARLPKFSGYVQAGYQYSDQASTFFLKRVRLSLTGDIVPKLDYRIQFEFCKPQLVDAFIQYRPFNSLNIKLGQYKVPFSIENTDYSPAKFEFIDYPLVLQRLMGFSDICGISASGRELGAMLYGGFFKRDGYNVLNYDFGVFNGEGINTRDKNKSKDIAARITVKPVAGLQISGSYYWGEYGASCLKRERYAVGACYDRGPVVVRGEWMGGVTGVPDALRDLDSDGWYVMAGYRVRPNLAPLVRFENFTRDTSDRSANRQNNYTAGLLWVPVKHLRCQLNYTYEDYAASPDCNVLSVMFTGMF